MRIKSNKESFSEETAAFANSLKNTFFAVLRRRSQEMERELKDSLSQVGELKNGRRASSPPYHPPYKLSGELLAATAVNYTEDENTARIKAGTDLGRAPYAVYLEYGTARMKPRPYLIISGQNYFNIIRGDLRALKGAL